ncbi:hypothetical protein TYRP_000502, partial [Tyrophagus putrescentiae]
MKFLTILIKYIFHEHHNLSEIKIQKSSKKCAVSPLTIDWCHLVDRHRPTAWDTTRKLVVPQAVGADQPNDTSFQHLGFICKKFC